jgi:FG-GAP-like repeat/FG-GAP repeat
MKVVLTRMVVLACVLLCATGVRGQVPNPFVFSLGPGPSGAVAADLNGDGRVDLVRGDGTVFLANADGTFTQGMTVSIGSSPGINCPKPTCPILFTALALADVNGDGKSDLIVQSQYGLTYVLPGNGDGTFGAPKTTNLGIGIGAVKLVDVNGDGKLDLVGIATAPNGSNGVVFVSLGNGDGTFGSATLYLVFTGSSIQGVDTGDFNGDGKIDIVATSATGSAGVLLGNGDGTFATSATLTSAGLGFAPNMGVFDFDGDGKLDLLVSAQGTSDRSPQIYFLAGNGNGTFKAGTIVAPGSGFISIADLNGDGKEDAIVWGNPMIEVLLGKGDGTFIQNATYPNGTLSGSSQIAVGDFNGDGKLDVSNGSTVIFGKGDGTFQDVSGGIVNVPSSGDQALRTVTTGDFNGDGKSDLAVGSLEATPWIYILLGDGNGHYTVGNAYDVSTNFVSPTDLQTGDFNGDGKTDLIFSAQNSDNTVVVEVLLGNGDGTFGAPITTTLGSGQAGGPAPAFQVADFNGDGFSDIATILNGELAIVIGVGDGNFQSPVSYQTAATFGVGDFNGDGKADAVVCGTVGPAVLLGNGDGTFKPAIFPPPSIFGTSPGTSVCTINGVGDFNNDGATDIIINAGGGLGGSVELSNGDGTFTPISGAPLPANVATIADINGDGILDLIASDGVTTVWGNGDGTFGNQPVSFLPAWINPLMWANYNDQTNGVTGNAVFAATDFGIGLPGIAMIVQDTPGGEISLTNPLPAPAPDFLFSATIPGVVAPGGQVTMTVSSKAISGFKTDVALSCDGLPAGVTCSFAPPALSAASGQATLTIAALSSAAIGSYPFTLTGTAGGVTHNQQRAIAIASSMGATNADLRPVAINFLTQTAGTKSLMQTVNLTNAGSATLQISSVSIGGINAPDFAISSNGCGTSLVAYASCPITLAFSPTATGVRSATLMVSDNATGGLQVVNLSGNGVDFGVGAGSGGGTATVAAGKAATYSLSVAGSVGFSGNVSLSCSGAPTAATCAVSPATVTLTSGGSATATVTVTTTARSQMVTPVANRDERWTPSIYDSPRVVAIYVAGFALSIGLSAIFGARPRRRMLWAPVAACVLLLAGMTIGGCGGGSNSSSNSGGTTPPPSGGTATGTPAGNYTITVTATTGSGASEVSHTTQLTLVVQ